MIYSPPILQPDWSDLQAMVQIILQFMHSVNVIYPYHSDIRCLLLRNIYTPFVYISVAYYYLLYSINYDTCI